MPSFLLVALTAGLVAVHLRAPFRVSMAVLVGTTFLIPGALPIPNAPPTMVVVRIGLWVAAIGVVIRASRGDIPSHSIRPTRVLAALTIFVVVAYLLGVARGPYPSRPEVAFDLWLNILDQLIFLWVATVAVRVLGVRKIAKYAVVATVAASVIGVVEHYTGSSYAHWWFGGRPSGVIGSQRLEVRGADLRVRGASDFALEYAWVLACFMPLVALYALRGKRLVMMVLPAIVAAAIVFSITRSAFAGLAVGALAMLLSARGDRRILIGLGAAGLVAGVLYLGSGAIRHPYQSADPESEKVRARRLVLVTQEMAPKPWLGTGLDGLIQRGIKGTDNAALGTYGTVGVVGLTALVGAVGAALVTASYGAFRGDDDLAPIAGAVLGGLGASALGMFAFDTFSAPFSAWNLWLLAALGVGLYEEVRARSPELAPRPVKLHRDRLVLPAAGLTIGLLFANFAPTHYALDMRIFTLSSHYLTLSRKPNDDYIGQILIASVCDLGREAMGPKVKFDCFDPLNLGPGTGIARIEAHNVKAYGTALVTFGLAIRQIPNVHVTSSETQATLGRPTWARTAPVTGGLAGAEAALLLPAFALPRRRVTSRSATSSHSP